MDVQLGQDTHNLQAQYAANNTLGQSHLGDHPKLWYVLSWFVLACVTYSSCSIADKRCSSDPHSLTHAKLIRCFICIYVVSYLAVLYHKKD